MPRGMLSTMFDAITQRVADTMAALHDGAFAALQLVGRLFSRAVELLGEAVGDVVYIGVVVCSRKEEGGTRNEITSEGIS